MTLRRAECSARGARVLYGSDPLPFAGEEGSVGELVSVGEWRADSNEGKASAPSTYLRMILTAASHHGSPMGRYNSPNLALRRWVTNRLPF